MSQEPTLPRSGMMNRSRPSTMRKTSSRHNVAVKVLKYHLKNPNASTPKEDYIVGELLHDVPEFGLKAAFETVAEKAGDEPETKPQTLVRVMMPPMERGGGNRRDIFGLSRPRSGGPAMDINSRVVFERCTYDAESNTISAQFSHGAASSQQIKDGSRIFLSDILACVLPEKWNNFPPNQGWAGRTNVLIADVNDATIIHSENELREQFAFVLENATLGFPGFIMLSRKLCPNGVNAAEFADNINTRSGISEVILPNRVQSGAKTVWRRKTSDEVMAAVKRAFPALINQIGRSDFLVEFVPMASISQAKSLVPSNKALNPHGRDNSISYGLYNYLAEGDKNAYGDIMSDGTVRVGLVDVGWAPSNIVIDRQTLANGGEMVFSSYQSPLNSNGPMELDDIITPNMPDYYVEAVKRRIAGQALIRQKYWAIQRQTTQNNTHQASSPKP